MMIYISKGVASKEGGENSARVSRCGKEYHLSEEQAQLWQAGRFSIANANNNKKQSAVWGLESMGLVEAAEPDETARYRLLTNCVICLSNQPASGVTLDKNERLAWKWLKNAGFKLTISELVYLAEQNIRPDPSFFGKDNWHNLIHAIYTRETIFDRILEAKMEESPARNRTVNAVLGLLRKKRIVFV